MYKIKFTIKEIDGDYPDTEESKKVIATFKTLSDRKAREALRSTLDKAKKLMTNASGYCSNDSDSIEEFQTDMLDDFDIDITKQMAEKCITIRENNGLNLYTFVEIAEQIQDEITLTILDDDCDIVYNLEV